jgi:hypothetical protein
LLTIASLVYEIAAEDGIVFVGGGTQYLLAGVEKTLRVKIIAPKPVREQRIAHAYRLGIEAAMELVERSDHEQEEFNWAIYQSSWEDPLHWDLAINTEFMSAQQAADVIVNIVLTSSENIDLSTRWKASLRAASAINRRYAAEELSIPSLLATPAIDAIELHGDAPSEHEAARAIDIARSVAGEIPLRSHFPENRLD